MNADGGEIGFPQWGGASSHRKEFICTSAGQNYLAWLAVTYTSHSCKTLPIESELDHGEGVLHTKSRFPLKHAFPYLGILENSCNHADFLP